METILNQTLLWNIPLWRLIAAILIIFIGFASRSLITGFFKGFLAKRAKDSTAKWDDELVAFLPAPLAAISQILLWYLAIYIIKLPTKPIDFAQYIHNGLEAALAICITWLLLRIVDVFANVLKRAASVSDSKLDDQLVPLFRKTLKVVIVLLAMVMIIQNLGYSITSMIAGLGVGGLAIALAAKDTVANLFGSVVIFTDRPFHVGEWISFSDIEGTVEEVGFRTTRIRRFDKALVTVPNSIFSSTSITNHSQREIRRIKLNIGLTYETKPDQLRQVVVAVKKMLDEHPGIDQKFHFIHFNDFGASSLDLQLYCFTNTTVWIEYLKIREDLLLRIMEIIHGFGLEFAFPTQTVYLRDEKWPISH